MNRIVVFLLGVAVGLAAALLWQAERMMATPTTPTTPTTTSAQVSEPAGPTPVIARVEPDPPEIDVAPIDGPPTGIGADDDAPPLHEALAATGGDYEALIVNRDMMLGGRVKEVLSAENYFDFANRLATTPTAAAADHYQQLHEAIHQLPTVQSGAVYARNLACGERVCTVALVGADAAAAWSEYVGESRSVIRGEGMPVAFTERGLVAAQEVRTPYGTEWRLVIAVDDTIRSFTSRRMRGIRPGNRPD